MAIMVAIPPPVTIQPIARVRVLRSNRLTATKAPSYSNTLIRAPNKNAAITAGASAVAPARSNSVTIDRMFATERTDWGESRLKSAVVNGEQHAQTRSETENSI